MVLARDDRRSFLDAIAPPPGYELAAAIGTTYSVDLSALGVTLLTLAKVPWHDAEFVSHVAPNDVLRAVAQLEGRFLLFFEQARVKDDLPVDRRRVTNQLDRFLAAKTIDHGAFHPKVWVMRYTSSSGGRTPDMFRMLCASRNLTRGQCWEIAVCLEGVATKSVQPFGRDLASFISHVAVGRKLPLALSALLTVLPTVRFELRGHPGAEFLWQGPKTKRGPATLSLASALPAKASRALLLAPFVEAGFVRELARRATGELTVVTTYEALRKLPCELLTERSKTRFFAVRDMGYDEATFSLHAKMLLMETPEATLAFVGSANGTGNGWGRSGPNCEAMVKLHDLVTIDKLKAAFVGDKKTLFPWIAEVVEGDMVGDDTRSPLDQAQRELTHARFFGRYAAAERSLEVRAEALPAGVVIRVCPRAIAPGAFAKLEPGGTTRFAGLDVADISTLLLVRMTDETNETDKANGTDGTDDETGATREVAVTMKVTGLDMAVRNDVVWESELTADDMSEMLLLLLSGRATSRRDRPRRRPKGDDGAADPPLPSERDPRARPAAREQPTLEGVLRACADRPDRVREIERLLAMWPEAPQLASFRRTWTVLRSALETAR